MCNSRGSRLSLAVPPFGSPFAALWRHSSSSPRGFATLSCFPCRASAPLVPPVGRVVTGHTLPPILAMALRVRTLQVGLFPRRSGSSRPSHSSKFSLRWWPSSTIALHQRCLRYCCCDALLHGLPHSRCIAPSVAVSPDPLASADRQILPCPTSDLPFRSPGGDWSCLKSLLRRLSKCDRWL
jgi:hypothetical protein